LPPSGPGHGEHALGPHVDGSELLAHTDPQRCVDPVHVKSQPPSLHTATPLVGTGHAVAQFPQ
jgi:hypothetical protein